MSNWSEIDKAGRATLSASRAHSFVLTELLSNAWEASGVSQVTPRKQDVALSVTDDTTGFADLNQAITLFVESGKRAGPSLVSLKV